MAKVNKAANRLRERVKQKAKEEEFQGGTDSLKLRDGMGFYKPKKGKNRIIIVPFTMSSRNLEDIEPGEQWFRLQILKHFKIGAEDKSFICPRTIGKKCPICEHRQQLMNAGRGTDDPEVRALVAKKRDLYNVIDLADDAEKVKVWEISYHNFGKRLLEEIREADDDSVAAQFADIDNGAIITVRMVEETMGSTKFLSASRIDFTEREEMLDESILGQVVQFDKALVVHSYEKLAKIFYDQEDLDSDEDDSVDEEEDAASSSRRPKIKKIEPAKRPEPDEEDDDEEEEEEEEKPVPQKKPAKKQVKKPVKQPEPDEEDEEEDDDDEEDEKPIPQKKPVKKPVKQPEPEDDDDEEDEEDEEEEEKPVKKPAKKPEKKPTRPKRPEPEDEEDDEEDEEEEEKPVPQKKPVKKPKKPASDECPHGGEFGTDCDSEEMYAHCEQCDIWSECRDAADALLATQVKKPKTKK